MSTGGTVLVLIQPGLDAVPMVDMVAGSDPTEHVVLHLLQTDDAVVGGDRRVVDVGSELSEWFARQQ